MNKSNRQAAHDLIKRYREITLDEIKLLSKLKYQFQEDRTAHIKNSITNKLTGFNNMYTCTLCSTLIYPLRHLPDCTKCIFRQEFDCTRGVHKKTYEAILHAPTPTKLRNAYRKRADYIEKILNNTNPS